MHAPLLARTCLPTFYLYGRTLFHSDNLNIFWKFKTLHLTFKVHVIKVIFNFDKASSCLFQQDNIWGFPSNSYRLKATGYMGYNRSIQSWYFKVKFIWNKAQMKNVYQSIDNIRSFKAGPDSEENGNNAPDLMPKVSLPRDRENTHSIRIVLCTWIKRLNYALI